MGLKQTIIHILLSFLNIFAKRRPVKHNRIAFVTNESDHLTGDLKLIYDMLEKQGTYELVPVLIDYTEKTMKNNFLYMLNCFRQLFVISTSKLVLITDNNYVISNFKREGVTVVQIWHAAGAIKKFGNAIERAYPIAGYDYVIANAPYWKKPYSQAFSVPEDHVEITGMPRLDALCDNTYIRESQAWFYKKHPQLKDKKILLYAPTFRGDLYQGFTSVPFDAQKVLSDLDEDWVILYKYHPLLKGAHLEDSDRVINMNGENTHRLFCVADALVSDYSSIIFDFALLDKPMYFFVPDFDQYFTERGLFVDYEKVMPGAIVHDERELALAVCANRDYDIQAFRDMFMTWSDGENTKRVCALITRLMA